MNSRLDNALGLCMKAGKCQSGEFSVENCIKKGKARLVLVQQSASDNTKKHYTDLCAHYELPLLFIENVGLAIGKGSRIAVAVTDDSFKQMITNAAALQTEDTGVKNGK